MNGTNELQYESSVSWYKASSPPPLEMAKSIKEESVIYNTPCKDEEVMVQYIVNFHVMNSKYMKCFKAKDFTNFISRVSG